LDAAAFLAGAAAGAAAAGAATGAGAAAGTAAGDSFFVTFLTDTDWIAELIVLVPVEVFDMFKRTTYHFEGSVYQIFDKSASPSNSVSYTGLFFIEVSRKELKPQG
jgi:hypothetical protein